MGPPTPTRRTTDPPPPPDVLFGDELLPRPAQEVSPGCHWVPGWLTAEQQCWLVRHHADWAAGPVPAHAPEVHGGRMRVTMVPFGWVWTARGYAALDPASGAVPLPVPAWMTRLYHRALVATGWRRADEDPGPAPDAALLNHYAPGTSMGMHRDADERTEDPVVSLSVGDACTFRFGNTTTRTRPWTDLRLEGGDLVVFGGAARRAFHGVPAVHGGTAPGPVAAEQERVGLPGRLNLTLRVTGMQR
ncbi:alpha-ketoglutarate-dependent dioxygenase AlkB [Kytococcus schroeteri]|uniref:Alpha-ketoglutarate-dependent dioxygenase AlkB n=1 Tax=Kytococcus schroeteri TaxID=138300 RepID=A0A2I1PBW0_9MICO|nr:alpha-ketoglutarate-dependent dioxygenase AlkB [Kytococcus schroeteri]